MIQRTKMNWHKGRHADLIHQERNDNEGHIKTIKVREGNHRGGKHKGRE